MEINVIEEKVMKELDIQPLLDRYHYKLRETPMRFKRYLYGDINWNARIIGIKGSRGVGKTTLLLQRIKEAHSNVDEALYVSLDDMWFANNRLEDLVEYIVARGVRYLYLDEIHKYPEWTRVLKNIYDFYSSLKVVYTGSALLAIDHPRVDMSRRQTLYTLEGMSFREFLEYEEVVKLPVVDFQMLLKDHIQIAMDITKGINVIPNFEKYLKYGCYPFYKENREDFDLHLQEIVRQVIEGDIPQCEDVSPLTVRKLKSMLMMIAGNTPFEPNISRLADKLDCSRELCVKMLDLLDRAKLIKLMSMNARNYKQLTGIKKILGGDTNILGALSTEVDTGTKRETFFVNQLSVIGDVTLARQGDFYLDGKYLFEVGGSNKKFTQIADISSSWLAVDGIEIGSGARIPLWMFGLFY